MSLTLAHFALAAAQLPGVGRRRLRRLVGESPGGLPRDAAAFASYLSAHAPALRLRVALPGDAEAAWQRGGAMLRTCQRRAWDVLVIGGAAYPARLRRLSDPPVLLIVRGGSLTAARPRLAVIGTRETSGWGESAARACARAAVRLGAVVVAGLAGGIDTAAHDATVDAGGITWAVLPSALDHVYPASNQALSERIVAQGGSLVSEYLPGTRPHPTFFVERDRIQAALSDALLVVETGPTGGTLHTVRFARELGVRVYVLFPAELEATARESPDRLPPPQQGTWALWRDGAPRVEPDRIEDLLGDLGVGPTGPSGGVSREPFQGELFGSREPGEPSAS